jgi:hypothetical protein
VAYFRVPTLTNPNIEIHVATSPQEVQQANCLVFRSYVELGYWRDDPEDLEQNRYLSLGTRHVVVIADASNVIGTVSVIVDSTNGLPADRFQPDVMRGLRQQEWTIAEISSFAISKDQPHQYNLFHFLMAFILQYSFHYLAVDEFIAVCTPRHARFYELVYGFQKVMTTSFYDYVKVEAQMLTLNLVESYQMFQQKHKDSEHSQNFFRFLYRDEHPVLRFPPREQIRRFRNMDWGIYDKGLSVAV